MIALVTGSSRGIGRAAAAALARAGFDVAVNAPGGEDLGPAMAAVQAEGRRAHAAPFDVSDLGGHTAALDAIEDALGPLTCLVNNAGVGVLSRGDPLDATPESWDRCMAVNARGAFFLTQEVARRMLGRPRTGFRSVVTVSSANADAVAVPRAEYCASKAAAAMCSKVWAARLGPEGIHAYDVRPGLIETDLTAPVIEDYKRRAAEGLCLLPRVGRPEEVGEVIATLASGHLPYVTAQSVAVDGGMLLPRF